MDEYKKNPNDLTLDFEPTNENEGHSKSCLRAISAASKKKILSERNADDPPLPYSSITHLETTPEEKPVMGFRCVEVHPQESHPHSSRLLSISDSHLSVSYDPVNNYTSPRPAFLRYNPDRRKEILLRMRDEEVSVINLRPSQDKEKSIEEDLVLVASTPPELSSQDKKVQEDSEDEGNAEADDDEEEEEEVDERRPWCFRVVWKLLLLFGVFLFSHHASFPMNLSSSSIQENLPSTENSLYRNLLKTHMGLSEACLDIGEEMCGIKGPGSDFLAPYDDSAMGHLGDLAKDEFLMPDEVDRMLASDEKKSIDGIEFLEERDEGLMDRDGVQDGDELVVEERRQEPVSSHEFLEQEENRQGEGSGKEEILGNEITETSTRESVETPDDPLVSDGPHLYQEEFVVINSREEAQDDRELTESPLAPQVLSVSNLLHVDQAAEKSEFPTVYGTSSRWKLGLEFASKDLQLLLLSLLSVVIGLLSVLLKHFARAHHKSLRISSPSPTLIPSDKSVDEGRIGKDSNLNPTISSHTSNEHTESVLVLPPSPTLVPRSQSADESRIYPSFSVMDELRTEGKVSDVNPLFSSYSSAGIKGAYATRQPKVELLGEFSIVDGLASKTASGQTLKSKGFEKSEFSKSQWRREAEDSQFSQSEMSRTVKIKPSNSSSKVHPYHTPEPTPQGSYAAQEKLEKKEDTVVKGNAEKVVTTPLRRSSRLRNQVTSPTP